MTSVISTYGNWAAWKAANGVADDARKLEVLREFIYAAARSHVQNADIRAEWANKKFPGLGITERISTENAYVLEAPVQATVRMPIYAGNRADAEAEFARQLATRTSVAVTGAVTMAPPSFVEGPEDEDPNDLPDDAPTTVDATLAKLREVVLLATVAGPKICRAGADELLADFDLEPVPASRTFVVRRPAEAVLTTTVEAFDEETAERVASWRWENDRTGYKIEETAEPGDFEVTTN